MDDGYFFLDLDGTVTDPKIGITKSVAHALKYFDIIIEDLDSLCNFIGPPLAQSFQEYFHLSPDQCNVAVEKYREYYIPYGIYENVLYPGMEELLHSITALGCKLVLATSKPEKFAKQILHYFHLEPYFYFTGGSSMDLKRNTKEDVIGYILETCGIPQNSAVMIGDTRFDIIGAKAHNLTSVGVTYGYGSRESLEDVGADYIVDSVEELQRYMIACCTT